MDFRDPESVTQAVYDVPCPHCGRVHSVTPVAVLRPGDKATEELFRGQLNVVLCPDCDHRFALDIPLLFRDDHRQTFLYCLTLDDPAKWREVETRLHKLTRKAFEGLADDVVPHVRLALSRRSFIEKIALHARRLDDRIIEYLKFQLYRRKEDRIDPAEVELLYDFSSDDPEKLVFLLFRRSTGKPVGAVHFPIEVYRELMELLVGEEDWRKELEQLFPSYHVSADRLLSE